MSIGQGTHLIDGVRLVFWSSWKYIDFLEFHEASNNCDTFILQRAMAVHDLRRLEEETEVKKHLAIERRSEEEGLDWRTTYECEDDEAIRGTNGVALCTEEVNPRSVHGEAEEVLVLPRKSSRIRKLSTRLTDYDLSG